MATKKAVKFYGEFKGIYKWGVGFINLEVKRKWDEFWEFVFPTIRHCFWRNCIIGDWGEANRLVSTSAAVYLHPMSFNGIFVDNGICSQKLLDDKVYQYHFKSLVCELDEICKQAAEYCGGTFTMYSTKEFDIKIPEEEFEVVNDDSYILNCGEVVSVATLP